MTEETDGEQLPCVKADNCLPTRSTWRSGVRSMCAASSYLEGGPLMWMMPLHLHVNKKNPIMMMALYEEHLHEFILNLGQLSRRCHLMEQFTHDALQTKTIIKAYLSQGDKYIII